MVSYITSLAYFKIFTVYGYATIKAYSVLEVMVILNRPVAYWHLPPSITNVHAFSY